MEIVVSDTNIFVDLINIGILDTVLELPFEFHTVDSVIAEITDKYQRDLIDKAVSDGRLIVRTMDDEENMEIAMMYVTRSNNTSMQDCSVWYYAKKYNYRLLTGDRKLRLAASNDGVVVSGIIFLFDKIVEHQIEGKGYVGKKLRELYSRNNRLPKKEIEERVNMWCGLD